MPEFTRTPEGALILRGQPAPPKTASSSLTAALKGFMDAMRGVPKSEQWWIEKPRQASVPVSVAAPALPSYNQWNEIDKAAAERARIKSQLGEFPKRMMASPLVEGRLF